MEKERRLLMMFRKHCFIFLEDSQAIAVGVMHYEIPPCKITEKRFLIVLPSHELL
jgi:hypothetical protein